MMAIAKGAATAPIVSVNGVLYLEAPADAVYAAPRREADVSVDASFRAILTGI